MKHKPWTKADRARLRELYPVAAKSAVMEALPNRSWDAIQARAKRLKIKRLVRLYPAECKAGGPLAPLLSHLRQVRIERNICAATLSKKAGYAATCVSRWEGPQGSTIGSRPLQDWANALGFELVLVPLQRDGLSPLR